MASDFTRSFGLAHKLFVAGEAAGLTPALWNAAAESPDFLRSLKELLEGKLITALPFDPDSSALQEQLIPEKDRIVLVDRMSPVMYPPNLPRLVYRDLEGTGPARYLLSQVKFWYNNHQQDQYDHVAEGHKIHEQLDFDRSLLDMCLSIRDGMEIQKLGLLVFRQFFLGHILPLWKSVAEHRCGRLFVPCLVEDEHDLKILWRWLGNDFKVNTAVPRFVM